MKKKLLMLSLICMMTVSGLTGCKDNKDKTTVTTNQDGAVTVTEKVLEPGVEYTANFGEKFKYEKKNLDITFMEIAKTAETNSNGYDCYAFLFSCQNNGDEDLTIRMLDDFSVALDGKVVSFDNLFSAISAAQGALVYPDFNRYDSELKKGQSMTGFIPFQLMGEWQTMTVTYTPDSANSNDYIVYEVSRDKVVQKY